MSDKRASRKFSRNSTTTTNSEDKQQTTNKMAEAVNIVYKQWVKAPSRVRQVGRCDDGSYEIEKIERMRHLKNGCTQYLVKWEGWNEQYNSWVKAEDIFQTTLVEQFVTQLVSKRQIGRKTIPQSVKNQIGMSQDAVEKGDPDVEMGIHQIEAEYNEDGAKDLKVRADAGKNEHAGEDPAKKEQAKEKNDAEKVKQAPKENKSHDKKTNVKESAVGLFLVTKPSQELMRMLEKCNMLPPKMK